MRAYSQTWVGAWRHLKVFSKRHCKHSFSSKFVDYYHLRLARVSVKRAAISSATGKLFREPRHRNQRRYLVSCRSIRGQISQGEQRDLKWAPQREKPYFHGASNGPFCGTTRWYCPKLLGLSTSSWKFSYGRNDDSADRPSPALHDPGIPRWHARQGHMNEVQHQNQRYRPRRSPELVRS